MTLARRIVSCSFAFLVAAAVAGCGAPPKQVEAADVTNDTGADIQTGEPGAADHADKEKAGAEEVKASAEDMRTKCCEQCKAGLAKDRSGSKPEAVPCADFTDTLAPWCLEHFRDKPAMASECK
jgi:hypothetical protein